jgi:hypothetical protein
MGRKKRKAVEIEPSADDATNEANVPEAPPAKKPAPAPKETETVAVVEPESTSAPASSSYAVTSHSAEIIGEDIYVSDGSEDEEAETAEILLAGSRMGLMRRGLVQPSLMQPNRQWQRELETETDTAAEDAKREEELAKLDPAQRAARLLAEKQRKLEEAKETARRAESEENAGRDPCLFSKRTAFDIRMDQIEEKPWEHGTGDITDYFNYNFGEADWLEYSQQQLHIRQELTDASKQRRVADPTIVPVIPKAPNKQTPRVAVVGSIADDDTANEADATMQIGDGGDGSLIGPVMVKKDDSMDVEKEDDGKNEVDLIKDIGKGGAWGAGAAPGSTLARLIEEQERKDDVTAAPPELSVSERGDDDRYSDRHEDDWRDRGEYGGGYQQQQYSPPLYGGRRGGHFPQPMHHDGPPPPYYGGGRGRGYRPPYPPNPNMPPPWAARGRRGGRGGDFRGRHNDDYGGDRYKR